MFECMAAKGFHFLALGGILSHQETPEILCGLEKFTQGSSTTMMMSSEVSILGKLSL